MVSYPSAAVRRAVAFVAAANFAYFFVEFGVAQRIGSVSLFADSVDFLEDTAVNVLILLAITWSVRARANVGIVLAGLLLIPGLATLWTAWEKFSSPSPPEPWMLSLTGLGALAVNLTCAVVLTQFRKHSGSLTRAAFLSARNDAIANVAIVAAGLLTMYWVSGWPDLVVGLAIAAMNADAAREVLEAAREERRQADA
jgi:Co/Zn/Cd efflux system component